MAGGGTDELTRVVVGAMRRRKTFVFGLMAALTACTTATTASTTTTSTSTSTSVTTTTTTTTIEATTTTLAPTTTTTTLLEGNWATVPVVTSGVANTTLGWWDGTDWVQLKNGDDIPVEGGEDYQVVLEGASGVIQGSGRIQGCDVIFPSDLPGIQLSNPEALSRFIDDDSRRGAIFGVAISAGWELRPRPVTEGESHPDLEALAIGLLEERGFDTDTVDIVQAIDADLDGDGSIETFLVAEETELGNQGSDVYSILFAVSPFWDEPVVIAGSVIPEDETGFPASFRVSAIADLSGDGLMEVVVDGLAWENSWVTVHELTESGFVERIGAGCGV